MYMYMVAYARIYKLVMSGEAVWLHDMYKHAKAMIMWISDIT